MAGGSGAVLFEATNAGCLGCSFGRLTPCHEGRGSRGPHGEQQHGESESPHGQKPSALAITR